jgi:hypothetical protein
MPGIEDLVASGGKLGRLWVEGFFDAGDPLTQSGDLLA